MSDQKKEYFLSINELADLLGMTEQGVHQLIKRNKLPTEKIGSQRYLSPMTVRGILESRGATYQQKIISFQSQTGGVGKTTAAYYLALRASMYGARVLLVDLDEGGALTNAFQVLDPDIPVFSDVLKGKIKIEKAIIPISDHIELLGSHYENYELPHLLADTQELNQENVITKHLKPLLDKFDLIIVDCATSLLTEVNKTVALASDMVIVPANPDTFSIMALKIMMKEIPQLQKKRQMPFELKILVNKYDARKKLSFLTLTHFGSEYKDYIFPLFIRKNYDLRNIADSKKAFFDFKNIPAHEDFDLLTKLILDFPDLKSELKSEVKRASANTSSTQPSVIC